MKIELKYIRVNEDTNNDSITFTANLYIEGKKIATVIDDDTGSGYRYEDIEPENRLLLHNAEQYAKQAYLSTGNSDSGLLAEDIPPSVALDAYIYRLFCKHLERVDQRELNAIIKKGVAYGDGKISYRFVKFQNPITDLLKTDTGIAIIELALVKKVLPKIQPGEIILNKNIPEEILQRCGFRKEQYNKPEISVKPMKTTPPRQRKGKSI